MSQKVRRDSTNFAQRSRRSQSGRRDGFALAASLLALLLISALVTAVFFAAAEETRIGTALTRRQLAMSAAESAIEMTIAGWNEDRATPIGVSGTRASAIGGFDVPVVVHVTRFDSTLYWIVADAADSSSGSRVSRRIGVAVRVRTAPDHSITIDRISERWWSELF
jgi:type II secretory pathway pseudopilin PulG